MPGLIKHHCRIERLELKVDFAEENLLYCSEDERPRWAEYKENAKKKLERASSAVGQKFGPVESSDLWMNLIVLGTGMSSTELNEVWSGLESLKLYRQYQIQKRKVSYMAVAPASANLQLGSENILTHYFDNLVAELGWINLLYTDRGEYAVDKSDVDRVSRLSKILEEMCLRKKELSELESKSLKQLGDFLPFLPNLLAEARGRFITSIEKLLFLLESSLDIGEIQVEILLKEIISLVGALFRDRFDCHSHNFSDEEKADLLAGLMPDDVLKLVFNIGNRRRTLKSIVRVNKEKNQTRHLRSFLKKKFKRVYLLSPFSSNFFMARPRLLWNFFEVFYSMMIQWYDEKKILENTVSLREVAMEFKRQLMDQELVFEIMRDRGLLMWNLSSNVYRLLVRENVKVDVVRKVMMKLLLEYMKGTQTLKIFSQDSSEYIVFRGMANSILGFELEGNLSAGETVSMALSKLPGLYVGWMVSEMLSNENFLTGIDELEIVRDEVGMSSAQDVGKLAEMIVGMKCSDVLRGVFFRKKKRIIDKKLETLIELGIESAYDSTAVHTFFSKSPLEDLSVLREIGR
ncbi:MAG: hypothetical protein JXL85_06450, partial [Bacilli bacterium]|nr:hypothetical protein [Bacilli bacterium]